MPNTCVNFVVRGDNICQHFFVEKLSDALKASLIFQQKYQCDYKVGKHLTR